MFRSPEEGTQTSVYLACSPDVDYVQCKCFADCQLQVLLDNAIDLEVTIKLWNIIEVMVGITTRDLKLWHAHPKTGLLLQRNELSEILKNSKYPVSCSVQHSVDISSKTHWCHRKMFCFSAVISCYIAVLYLIIILYYTMLYCCTILYVVLYPLTIPYLMSHSHV